MSLGVNKAIILGNCGAAPELRYTNSGVAVCNFNLATSDRWTDGEGNKQESTEWHSIVCWKRLAEVASEYIKKGTQVYVEGKITTKSWEDKDGVKRYKTEIIANNCQILSSASGNRGQSEEEKAAQDQQAPGSSQDPPAETPVDSAASPDNAGSENDLPF